jgi:hypothetical protein
MIKELKTVLCKSVTVAYRNFKENFDRLTNKAVTHLFLRLGVAFYLKGRERCKDLNFEVKVKF